MPIRTPNGNNDSRIGVAIISARAKAGDRSAWPGLNTLNGETRGIVVHLRKRVLVTGGAGFLGSHLCDQLVKDGADVICTDNFFTGTRDNVKHPLKKANFELIRHDVTFSLYVEVDQVFISSQVLQ